MLYLKEAAGLLAGLSSPIERDVYAGKLAQELSVSKEALLSQVESRRRQQAKKQQERQLSQIVRQSDDVQRRINPEAQKHPRAVSAEEALLGMLILHPDYIEAASQVLPPEEFVTSFNRRLYERLHERHRNGLLIELAFLASDFSEEEMGSITRMVREARERVSSREEVVRCADVIRKEHQLLALEQPERLSEEDIRKLLEAMRDKKS